MKKLIILLSLILLTSCAGFEIVTLNHTPVKKTRVVVDYTPPVVYHYPTWPHRYYTYFEPARVIVVQPQKQRVKINGRRGSTNSNTRSTSSQRRNSSKRN